MEDIGSTAVEEVDFRSSGDADGESSGDDDGVASVEECTTKDRSTRESFT